MTTIKLGFILSRFCCSSGLLPGFCCSSGAFFINFLSSYKSLLFITHTHTHTHTHTKKVNQMESSGQSRKGYIDNKVFFYFLFFIFEKKIDDKLELTKRFAFNTQCLVWPIMVVCNWVNYHWILYPKKLIFKLCGVGV